MFSKLAKLLFSKILGMWNELQIGLVSYVELTYRLNHKMFLFGNIYAMCSRYQEIKLKLVTALMIKVEISFPFIDGAVSWKNQGKCYKLEISNILFWIKETPWTTKIKNVVKSDWKDESLFIFYFWNFPALHRFLQEASLVDCTQLIHQLQQNTFANKPLWIS